MSKSSVWFGFVVLVVGLVSGMHTRLRRSLAEGKLPFRIDVN